MTTEPMTLSEILDWHARRLGWTFGPTSTREYRSVTVPCHYRWSRDGSEPMLAHPVQPTLDAIADLLPPGCIVNMDAISLFAVLNLRTVVASVPRTADEKHDRALLAKLAWEKEATK